VSGVSGKQAPSVATEGSEPSRELDEGLRWTCEDGSTRPATPEEAQISGAIWEEKESRVRIQLPDWGPFLADLASVRGLRALPRAELDEVMEGYSSMRGYVEVVKYRRRDKKWRRIVPPPRSLGSVLMLRRWIDRQRGAGAEVFEHPKYERTDAGAWPEKARHELSELWRFARALVIPVLKWHPNHTPVGSVTREEAIQAWCYAASIDTKPLDLVRLPDKGARFRDVVKSGGTPPRNLLPRAGLSDPALSLLSLLNASATIPFPFGRCETCERVFFARRAGKRFCSTPCRYAGGTAALEAASPEEKNQRREEQRDRMRERRRLERLGELKRVRGPGAGRPRKPG
jgi:hypothetical protein